MSASLWQQAPAAPPAMAAVQVRPALVVEPPPKPPDTPVPLPAQILAPPMPMPATVQVEPPAPPAAPIARPEPPAAVKAASECFAPLAIAFERGSTRPNPADMKRSVTILQKALTRHADATLVIEGHADASGSEDLNVLLSYSRAKAVAELLKKGGIASRQIAVRAAGAGAAHGNADAVAGDRRAIMRIAGIDDCDQLTATKQP
ncbi:OmpA family protein [Bradyrhizobium sp. SSBR45R]|uniref:OmpA family protein n=2 Tax=unclassified Bradyrhizobium TaxID=2631580 RepID=UPI0024E0A7E1|nr:OmpA family protein [Bradyrhizobium sp. SSBR45R]